MLVRQPDAIVREADTLPRVGGRDSWVGDRHLVEACALADDRRVMVMVVDDVDRHAHNPLRRLAHLVRLDAHDGHDLAFKASDNLGRNIIVERLPEDLAVDGGDGPCDSKGR